MKQTIKKMILNRVHRKNQSVRNEIYKGKDYLCPSNWGLSINAKGNLSVCSLELGELSSIYGTPLHVVSADRLTLNYTNFLQAFRQYYSKVEIAYSYKTNPLPDVIKQIHQMGGYAEVISHFELWLACELGVLPDKIIFNGPAKTEKALSLAVSNNILMINIDSENEIETIATLAEQHGNQQRVGVRVVTSVGWAAQFGIPIAGGRAFSAYEKLNDHEYLDPKGIHIHLGTGIRDIATYCQAISEVMDFVIELKSRLGIELDCIDFGGGFGVPTVQNFSFWDNKLTLNGYPPGPINTVDCAPIADYAKAVFNLLGDYLSANDWLKPTIFLEPGRAITSSAQCLLLSVLNIKPGKQGRSYAVVDGGKNLSMPLGYEQHEVFSAVGTMSKSVSIPYDIVGPLCYPEDILYTSKFLTELRKGDVLAIMDSGAYFVPNQQNFSNPRAAVAMVSVSGTHRLIRSRESFGDMVALDAHFNGQGEAGTPIAEM